MTAKKSAKKAAPQETEEQPSVQITPEQAADVEYEENVAPSVSETEFALANLGQDENPEGDVIKDGVVQSTDRSRREAEKAQGGE